VAKISQECIDAAFEALKTFTRPELEDYVRDVFVRAKEYGDVGNMKAFEKAMKEINDERLQSYFADSMRKANNVLKFQTNEKWIREGKSDARGLIIARQEKQGTKLSRNISNSQKADYEKFTRQVLGDFTPEEVEKIGAGELDDVIIGHVDGKESKDPFVKRVADKIKEWFEYRNSQLVLSDAMSLDEINQDRFFRAIHDQSKIINANKSLRAIAADRYKKRYSLAEHKATWRNLIKPHLDLEGTFAHTNAMGIDGVLDMKVVDKILDRIFDNITTGKSEIFTRSQVANDREAVQRKSRMFFKWKDLKSLYEYNKVYGRGNLFGMLMNDIKSSANKSGMAKIWGDNPYSMYNDLRHVQESVAPKGSRYWNLNDVMLKDVMGQNKSSISPTRSNFLSNLRTVATMARLPLIAVDSVSDVGYIASFAQRMGIDYTTAWTNQMSHLLDSFPTEERRRISRLFHTQASSHLGYMGRFTSENNASDFLNKVSTGFFKKIGLDAFDRGNKVGMMHLMAKHLAESSSRKLKDMNPKTARWVDKFLDEDEWNLLRRKNQNGLFTTENVDALSDAELREHYGRTDKLIPLNEVRDDLYRKVHSMFTVASENSVLSPGEFERAMLLGGTQAGTLQGDLLRTFLHFKQYAFSFIDRVLVQGFREADTASQKLIWATSMLAGTIPLSVASMFFHNAAMGLSMPSMEDMSVPERTKFLLTLLAPSLSIFSGILDPRHQNGDMLWSLLGSPMTNLIGNALAVPGALLIGRPDLSGKALGKAANYIFPIQTTPGISPFIRQALGQEAHLEPGQTHYFGQ